MKRLALVAAVLVLAACTTEDNTPANDTAAPAMAPAPADTGMKADSAAMDTTKADTSKSDTTKTP